MKDNIQSIRDQLIQKLNKLVKNSEEIYLDLARDFPLLLHELDESVRLSTSSIDNLKSNNGSFESIDLIINEGNQIIDYFNNAFKSMYSRDGELFEIIKRGVTEMSSLAEVINNIKEGSIEMELISLNAMTVALKSGTAGKAFSFITDELKKLSAQTIKLTEELTVIGNHQLSLFENFGNKIELTRKTQDELTKNIDQHLKSSFTTTSRGIQESVEMMSTISGSSKDVKTPLMRIMQEIQLQDIIRQSIDHIYISIDEFKIFDDNWTTEERLDELSFRKMMPDLCFSVLEEVKTEIEES
nr:methyl-accepting chemotaxis protein [Spirochaetaceae bacterium]